MGNSGFFRKSGLFMLMTSFALSMRIHISNRIIRGVSTWNKFDPSCSHWSRRFLLSSALNWKR